MKATLLTSAIALVALSATAAPQQTTQQAAPAEQQGANVPQQTISEPQQAKTGDSPLVAAAKRTGRLGKKPTQVITNDTLLKSGGHFTTTKEQAAVPAPLPVPAAKAQVTAAKKTSPPAKKEDKDAALKQKALKRAVADYMGESIEEVHDDPAVQEGLISKAMANQPQSTQAPNPVQAPTPPAPAKPPGE